MRKFRKILAFALCLVMLATSMLSEGVLSLFETIRASAIAGHEQKYDDARVELDFNKGWKFNYGDVANAQSTASGKANASHTQAASTITAGTFAGQVVAKSNAQTPGTSLLRNSKLVSADTNPSNDGEINWTYG